HRLDGLDGADLVSGVEDLADLGQLDEDDLAELLLRELGDAEHAHVVLDAEPLVLPRIEILARVHSSVAPPVGLMRETLPSYTTFIWGGDRTASRRPGRRAAGRARRGSAACRERPGPEGPRPGPTLSRTSGSRCRW